jgi:hypothetical protein
MWYFTVACIYLCTGSCHACDQGKISAAAAASECVNCEVGKFGASTGLTTCENCAAGNYSGAGAGISKR